MLLLKPDDLLVLGASSTGGVPPADTYAKEVYLCSRFGWGGRRWRQRLQSGRSPGPSGAPSNYTLYGTSSAGSKVYRSSARGSWRTCRSCGGCVKLVVLIHENYAP
jgi:hypothetical protein